MKNRRLELALVVAVAGLSVAWEPLWRNQPDIEDGVASYQEKKWSQAQGHFEAAAKEIPDTPELHLDRGAALYQQAVLVDAQKRFAPMTTARDEFQRALGLDAAANKAAAWHNLSTAVTQLAILQTKTETDKEGKESTKPQEREERMGLCTTAIDGFKKALQLVPEDVDTKFNLEVAQRLLEQLEEEKKKEEEEKKKKDQKKDDQKKDEQNKDQKKDEQKKDDQKKDDQQKQDQNKDQKKDDQQKQDQNKDQKQDEQKQEEQKKREEEKKREEQKKQEEQQKKEEQKKQEPQPAELKKAPPLDLAPLEALKNSEKPLQLYRIMMDPKKSRVNVKKDW